MPATSNPEVSAATATAERQAQPSPLRPETVLCVDLDGTLVKSDTLVDSVLVIARQKPSLLLSIPGWIAQGKASFKRHVTSAVALDVEHLPYNRPLLEYLRAEHAAGRTIYLATAADRILAERVAAHLGLFAGVLASDGATNLAGHNKLAAFQERFGANFCYIGNASPDIPLLAACESPMAANPTRSLRAALKPGVPIFEDRTSTLKSWLKAIRLHQWAKNTLIFVPLLLAHEWNLMTLAAGAIAFVSFGLCASATYIINDLLDLEADRKHPSKRRRPFAAGNLSAIKGVLAVAGMMLASAALAIALPYLIHMPDPHNAFVLPGPDKFKFLEWLVVYTVTTLTYSLYLKRKLLLDVFILSGLYTVRILAGGAATAVPVSPWLCGFSVFFFLSLAFVKRFSELESLRQRGGAITNGRGYFVADLEQLRALGTGAAYASVVILTLYINNGLATNGGNPLYHHLSRLWLAVIVLLLWMNQVWMLAGRGEMHDDPVVWAITDKRSLLLGALMAAVVLWAAM